MGFFCKEPSFCSFSVFPIKHCTILQQIYVKNVHPVFGTRIRTHNLLIMSPPPLTTRPTLPPMGGEKLDIVKDKSKFVSRWLQKAQKGLFLFLAPR